MQDLSKKDVIIMAIKEMITDYIPENIMPILRSKRADNVISLIEDEETGIEAIGTIIAEYEEKCEKTAFRNFNEKRFYEGKIRSLFRKIQNEIIKY